MKKLILGIFLILSFAYVQAQTPDSQAYGIKLGAGYGGSNPQGNAGISFSASNKIKMWNKVGDNPFEEVEIKNEISGTYTTSSVNGLDFITISWKGVQEKFLYLLNNKERNIYLYKADSDPYFGKIQREDRWDNAIVFGDSSWVKASSSFQETIGGKTVIYSPDKLGYKIGECWVPAKPLNEKLTLSIKYEKIPLNTQRNFSLGDFYISSGFVSFSKPHLYSENARPKKIRLSSNTGKSITVELKDTPHFQLLPIKGAGMFFVKEYGSSYDLTAELTIEILEVYPGSKYQDLCVNAICYYWSDM